MQTPADRILEYLKERGITQSFLARKVGLKPQTLSAKLNKHIKLSIEEIELICGVLGCQPGDFLKVRSLQDEAN